MEETAAQAEGQQIPPVDFISYLANLVETGRLYLEGIPNPETDEVVTNLPLVKHIIDTIEMLEEKTKGNLTAPEANFLANTLYELRMGYVRAINIQETVTQPEGHTEETEEEVSTENIENPS